MRILITGGAGYLGSVVTEAMLGCGHEVMVVDTFEHGVPSLAHLMRNENLVVLRRDLTDASSVAECLRSGPEAVIHLAAIVGADACDARQATARRLNFGTSVTLAKCLEDDIKLLYPCTNSGYGVGGPAECDETSPLSPVSLYGRTKVEAEREIMKRKNSVSLRLATLFGWSSRMRRDLLVNDMVWRAVRDRSAVIFEGGHRRNFCHVRDAGDAFVHVLDNWDAMRGQVYNVGDTRANMTKLSMCSKIQEHIPHFRFVMADHAVDPDKRDYVVSNAKIEATGWRPERTLDDGIEELIRGYAMLPRETMGNA